MRKRQSQSLRRAILKIHVVQKREQVGNPLIKTWSIKYQISGNKKTAAEQSAAVVLLVLCAGIFSAVLHRRQCKSFTDFVPNHFVSNFLLQTSYHSPTIFHHIGPMPRKQIRNRIEQTKPTFHHSGWVI